jgi:hypothetical protein
MARKKPSGAKRERDAPFVRMMKSFPALAVTVPKRGGPKRITSRSETRRLQLTADFLWAVGIGKPRRGELAYSDSLLARELLREDKMRTKNLRLGKRQYGIIGERALRREIGFIRSQIYAPTTPLRMRFQLISGRSK